MSEKVTIDLVTHDPHSDEFVLYLVEDGPWPTRESEWKECLKGIQDRILAAADAAIDGHLAQKYPDSVGKSIRIQVDSPNGCPDRVDNLVAAVKTFLNHDPSYISTIGASPHIRGLRVVTAKEMGRFDESKN